MSDKLKTQIDDLGAKLHALVRQREGVDRQIETLKIRLEAFREAYAMVTGRRDPVRQDGEGTKRPTIVHPDPWEDALIEMKARGQQFTTDEIIAEDHRRGGEIIRMRARSRLSHLVDQGTLRRIQEGVFEFPGHA